MARFDLAIKLQTAVEIFETATLGPTGCVVVLQDLHARIDHPRHGDNPDREYRVTLFLQEEAKFEGQIKAAYEHASREMDRVVEQFKQFK